MSAWHAGAAAAGTQGTAEREGCGETRGAQDCEDERARAVMDHLFNLAKRWLDYDASDPIQVHSSFKCGDNEMLTHHDQMDNQGDFCIKLLVLNCTETGYIYSRSRSHADSLAVADAC